MAASMCACTLSWPRVWLTVLAGAVLSLGALLTAATLTSTPALFLGTGLAAFLLISGTGLGVQLARQQIRVALWRADARAGLAIGLSVLGFVLTALVPMHDPRLPPAPVDGLAFWELPTGSRIAHVRREAVGGSGGRAPVVFVHGGPGVADMRGDAAYFGQLAHDGVDVYVYDGVGTGRSSRLADPRAYTLERDVADLASIREQIGAERITWRAVLP